jgi:aminodeoxychorismate lyase
MIVFLNGKFVPEEEAVISVFDRSFLYGDGLFETMRVCRGKPFRWEQHLERFERGAKFLKIQPPFSAELLRELVSELVTRNQMPEALLRLSLSRGVGLRGYSPKGAERPSLVMSLHPALPGDGPVRWKLVTSSFRLPANEPLAAFKTCNKLPQILARAEADAAGADEALLLNTDGHVVEAASSNLFWIQKQMVFTPPLASGILPGVTRAEVLEISRNLGIEVREAGIGCEALQQAQGVFLSLSSVGIAEGSTLDGHALSRSRLVDQLRTAYAETLSKS